MNQNARAFSGAMLLTLLGGASLGALAVALTTPKTGREVRHLLKGAAAPARTEAPAVEDEDGPVRMLFV
jgi:gas vesicle protein